MIRAPVYRILQGGTWEEVKKHVEHATHTSAHAFSAHPPGNAARQALQEHRPHRRGPRELAQDRQRRPLLVLPAGLEMLLQALFQPNGEAAHGRCSRRPEQTRQHRCALMSNRPVQLAHVGIEWRGLPPSHRRNGRPHITQAKRARYSRWN